MNDFGSYVRGLDCVFAMVVVLLRDVEWQGNRVRYVDYKKNGVGIGRWRRVVKVRDNRGQIGGYCRMYIGNYNVVVN